ncbi:hypothetical protein SAMN05428988_3715 [Chitinophaga sp. YR573]|uniref:hypothetical protein n=1 Tax=Chitinophaga sp. YR573 TaxID=1881040 RepID=UPI0008D65796|nr:hypothetical protein [Chitinophaga sp. YR573]SEW26070.1 hypothetical protein SAMN05428988_3715 [Chitinophaga sp. YR573]
MRKAKLLLLIIAVFSLVGGTYAFNKMQRHGFHVFTRAALTTTCGVLRDGFTTTTFVLGQLSISNDFVTDIAGDCPVRIGYYTGLS